MVDLGRVKPLLGSSLINVLEGLNELLVVMILGLEVGCLLVGLEILVCHLANLHVGRRHENVLEVPCIQILLGDPQYLVVLLPYTVVTVVQVIFVCIVRVHLSIEIVLHELNLVVLKLQLV